MGVDASRLQRRYDRSKETGDNQQHGNRDEGHQICWFYFEEKPRQQTRNVSAAGTPIAIPIRVVRRPWPSTIQTTSRRWAPFW